MKRRTAVTVVAAALALVFTVWIYRTYQERAARTAVIELIADGGARLHASWPRQNTAAIDVAEQANAVEMDVAQLRKRDTSRVRALADAADDYLVSVREILRRQGAMDAARARVAKDAQTLAEHLRTDRGRAAWPQQAVQLKDALDRALREYRIASESYASLLQSLPASQAKIAPHLRSAQVLNETTVRAAAELALDALARTDENVRELTRLDAYRGSRAGRRSP